MNQILNSIYFKLGVCIILIVPSLVISVTKLENISKLNSLHNSFMTTEMFRNQDVYKFLENIPCETLTNPQLIDQLCVYLLDSHFCKRKEFVLDESELEKRLKFWSKNDNWDMYRSIMNSIWKDIQYFPVPLSLYETKSNISFDDSWGLERTYGGNRVHEGTDLFPTNDVTGYYPILSITDGIVTNMGWLEQGGYRIGVMSPSGGYFYYAHLDSYANIEKGDSVKAGQLLGYMGDSGYGEEGTTGKFPVHLHVGVYIFVDGEEISVNPYSILKYLESYKLKYKY